MQAVLPPEDYQALRRTPLFSNIPDETIHELLLESTLEEAPARTPIFNQGEPASSFFLVLEGWLKVARILPSGFDAVIGLFTRGEAVAEAIALAGYEYPAYGEAVTPVRYIRISAMRVRWTIAHDPGTALAMLASAAQHLHVLMQQIAQLKSLRAPDRAAEFLLSLTKEKTGSAKITLPFDKVLIAARLGMQPESLSRAFMRLRASGVEVKGHDVWINDIAALRNSFESVSH